MIGKTKEIHVDYGINRIVEDTSIEGVVQCQGSFRIDGTFKGDLIVSDKLVVGETGKVEGFIECEDCEFYGSARGDINVRGLLTLRPSSKTKGNIRYKRMIVEEGAKLVGTFNLIDASPKIINKGSVSE